MKEPHLGRESRPVLPWLLLLFVGSGCAALIYEIVWLQMLQLVIGLTNLSLGVLLGTYMGGMCLGSLLLPRLVPPDKHPLRVYAALEFGIGAIGVLILFVLPWVSHIYTEVVGHGLPGILLRGCVAALCLLPPTVLMGATLPAIARWVELTREGSSWLGFFYGGNIAGAVMGCLAAGFYLLRIHDMATATFVAASINVLAGTAAWALSNVAKRQAPPQDAGAFSARTASAQSNAADARLDPLAVGDSGETSGSKKQRIVYVAIALSGLTALGAEVVWTRLLSLVLGGTVYTFSIILAVFLVGLGIGSGLGAFLSRSVRRPVLALGWCQTLLVLSIFWTAWMIADSLPYWPVNPALALNPWYSFQLDLARCLWTVLPPTLLWGASFPLALAAVSSSRQDSGRVVGGVYAANTVGAIVGSLAFSLVLIPQLGTQNSERILLGLAASTAALIFLPHLWRREVDQSNPEAGRAGRFSFGTGAALLILLGTASLLILRVSPIPWGLAAYGRFMATYGNRLAPGIRATPGPAAARTGPYDIYCNYLGEGLNGTVAVTEWTSGIRNFHSAGKVQASTEPRDMRLQRMLGHISALAHPKPESVLVVACGAGVTAGTFVLHPEVKRIVICDIEPLVPKFVAPRFEKENNAVVKDPRTQVVFDDGRHFIRTTKEKFDIITSDPIDPWVKGCAALNTVEYYQMCKEHLNPGGVFSLWIPLYESNSTTAKSLIATFFKVFPNGIIFSNDSDGEGYDAVLFAQAEPTRLDMDRLQDRLDRPDHALVKKSLSEVNFRSVVSLFSTYAGQASDLTGWTSTAEINTDRNLRLQYLAGMGFNSYIGAQILGEILQYRRFPEQLFVGSDRRRQMLRIRFGGIPQSASSSAETSETR